MAFYQPESLVAGMNERAGIYVVLLIAKVQRRRLVRVRYAGRKDSDAGHFGIVGNAHATHIVLDGCNLARAPCPVLVVR
jgi:hypothetical protein